MNVKQIMKMILIKKYIYVIYAKKTYVQNAIKNMIKAINLLIMNLKILYAKSIMKYILFIAENAKRIFALFAKKKKTI